MAQLLVERDVVEPAAIEYFNRRIAAAFAQAEKGLDDCAQEKGVDIKAPATPTASPLIAITIGIVVVAAFAANAGALLTVATITATRRRTRSAASSGSRA